MCGPCGPDVISASHSETTVSETVLCFFLQHGFRHLLALTGAVIQDRGALISGDSYSSSGLVGECFENVLRILKSRYLKNVKNDSKINNKNLKKWPRCGKSHFII